MSATARGRAAKGEPPGGDPASDWQPGVNPWLIATAVMLATFMEVLDTSVANVALPHIAGSLSASTDESTWVLTSYLVSNAIILPATGWLSRLFGRKRFLLGCILTFTLASLSAGSATSLGMLVTARAIQGIGGGALQPISQAVLLESFPRTKRGVAMAVFGMGVVVAPIIGPTLGGWLTDNYTWRWVFYINLPVGVLAVLLIQAFVEDPPYLTRVRGGSMDYLGFGLLAIWLSTLQILLDKGQEADWFASTWMRWFALVSVVALVAFILREFWAAEPIVDLRVFANRNFAIGTLLMAVVGAALYSTIALLPLFLQDLLGYTALQSGLTLSPRGIGAILAMALVARLVRLIDNRFLIAAGFAGLAVSVFQFAAINLNIGMADIIWPNVFNGMAIAFIFVPLTTTTMGELRNDQIGTGTGIFNLMRNIGGSFGIAATTTLLARGAQIHQAAMVPHLNPYNPIYRMRLHALQHAAAARLGPLAAAQAAYQALYSTLITQATLAAFVDIFQMLAFLCLCGIPFVLLFRRVAADHAPVPAH